jgi:hypothetical protein
MGLNKYIRDLLFFLYALYYAQESLYATGSLISQSCILLILLISGFYFFRTLFLKKENTFFYYSWTLLLVLNILGYILTADFSDPLHNHMFKSILGCMLSFYPFYYFAVNGELKSKHLIRFSLILLPVIILRFYTNRYMILFERSSDESDLVNNFAYLFVSLIPYFFLIKKNKIIAGLLMGIIIFFIIQGAKRGAIIGGFMGIMMYFYYQIKTIEKSNRIQGLLIAVLIIIALSAFAYTFSKGDEYMLNRMLSTFEGNGSNREVLYYAIFNEWYNCSNIWNYLFGFGFASSIDITGFYAHNDWLELLCNFGVLGVFIYLVFFFSLAKIALKNEWKLDKKILMFTIIMIWFVITLISKRYSSFDGYSQAILFGYLIGSKSNSLE